MSTSNNEKSSSSSRRPSFSINRNNPELHDELEETDAPNLDGFPHHNHDESKIGSPLGLWSPKTSPLNGKASSGSRPSSTLPHGHGHPHDDLSVNLFSSSFDTSLTEPGLRSTFDRDPPPLSPPSVAARDSTSVGNQQDSDIALPDLKHQQQQPEQLDTFGEISPIKVSYSEAPPPHLEARREPFDQEDAHWPCDSNGDVQAPVSNPFYVIRFAASAFSQIKYKLPCLEGEDTCPVNMNTYGQIRQYKPTGRHSIPLIDTKIATMRVEAAICAFGGTLQRRRYGSESIFRVKNLEDKSVGRQLYDKKLPHRFVLTGSKISWDFEEEPPIVIPPEDERDDVRTMSISRDGKLSTATSTPDSSLDAFGTDTQGVLLMDSSHNKMKYRCKMCGQLKNNHVCPYRQPLQRSIGVMVYPAVNSFTAFEPGTIAPPLTKMNNFVSYDSETLASRPVQAQGSSGKGNPPHPTTVTPEAGVGLFHHSPQSSLSNHSEDGATPAENLKLEQPGAVNYEKRASRKRLHEQVDSTSASADADTKEDSISAKRALFVTAVALKPEHYRSVSQSAREDGPNSYQYASIPLTFAERKRLSDSLFVLSKEVPTMTTACAGVLREARENNEWDIAIAELLTQIIVGLFCTEEDLRLEGLQRYLLEIGISC